MRTLRLHERDHGAMQCLNCFHVWRERAGDYGQASEKAKPARLHDTEPRT